MSLFVLASKDGWVNIMYHGLDAVAIDQQVSLGSGEANVPRDRGASDGAESHKVII